MPSIRAHFDGKVFVPDDPVDIPPNTPVRLVLASVGDEPPLAALGELAESLPDVPGWPTDGAAKVDHFLYGSAKRPA